MPAIESLKASIKHYLSTVGYDATLCRGLLKLVDFLEDQDAARRENEIEKLARLLIRESAVQLIQLATKCSELAGTQILPIVKQLISNMKDSLDQPTPKLIETTAACRQVLSIYFALGEL